MARGKDLSLKEATGAGKLDEFARQHEIPAKDRYPDARERFDRLLDHAAHGALEGKQKRRKHKVR